MTDDQQYRCTWCEEILEDPEETLEDTLGELMCQKCFDIPIRRPETRPHDQT